MAEWGDPWGSLFGGAIAQVTDHEQQAVDDLKFHLKGKVNAEASVRVRAERWQILENLISDMFTLFGLETAFGDIQDKLGAVLNVSRSGFDDDDYARFLFAKTLVLNRKRRTVDGLLGIARALLGPKTLESVEPFVFNPSMSTLTDAITASEGVADGTTYDADLDARVFDGLTDRVDWTPGIFNFAGVAWSLSARIVMSDLVTEGRIFSTQRAAASGSTFVSVTVTGQIVVFISNTVTNALRISTDTIAVGEDRQITVTHDGGLLAAGIRIYIDGFEVAYTTTTDGAGVGQDTDFKWSLGGRELNDTVNIAASIRDVIAWDRELTAADIQTVFRGGKRFIGYEESYPKSFQLTLEEITTDEEIIFREFLRVARPATYNGTIFVVPALAFGYGDATATITDTNSGYGSTGPGFGGPYAHVLGLF